MKIPNKVKVGGLTYEVIVLEELDDERAAATCNVQTLKIKIEKTNPKAAMEHHFIHELIHAINSEMEEEPVEYLASMLFQVIVDNPGIFSQESEVSSKDDKHRHKVISSR